MTHSAPSTSCPLPHLSPPPRAIAFSPGPSMQEGEAGGRERERARGSPQCLRALRTPWKTISGLSGHCTPPGPPACSLGRLARARGGALWLFCPFLDEFCILISILPLNIVTIIYSFFSVSVPRSPGSALAFLPRRPSACALVGTPYA